jgi:hypothetical protein
MNPLANPWALAGVGGSVIVVGILVGVLVSRKDRLAEPDRSPGPVAVQPAAEKPAAQLLPGEQLAQAPAVKPEQPADPAPKPEEVAPKKEDPAPKKDAPVLSAWVGETEVVIQGVYQDEGLAVYDQFNRHLFLQGDQRPLIIHFKVINHSRTRKVDYQTWQVSPGLRFSLDDDLGNHYRLHKFDLGDDLYFREKSPLTLRREYTIHPGDRVTDFLFSERPVAPAKMLFLTLPQRNVGGSGTLKLQMPPTLNVPKPVEPAKPAKGILVLKAKRPVRKGIEAWVEIDGERKADWPEGADELGMTLPAGEHQVTVYSMITVPSRIHVSGFAKIKQTIYDKKVNVPGNETTTVNVE